MLHRDQITGVILAGGKSSRFGSNKAFCEIEGSTFVQNIISKLKPYTQEVILSGSKDIYKNLDIPVIPDQFENIGPIGGIYSALHYSSTPWILVCTCDMPLISGGIIMKLLTSVEEQKMIAWNFEDQRGLFPLLISKDMLVVVEEMIRTKQYRIKNLLQNENTMILDIPQEWQHLFVNINTYEEYKQIINE